MGRHPACLPQKQDCLGTYTNATGQFEVIILANYYTKLEFLLNTKQNWYALLQAQYKRQANFINNIIIIIRTYR